MDHQLLLPHSLLPCAVSCSKLQFRAPSPWLQCAPPAVCSISSPCPSHLLLCLSQMCCPGLTGAGWQNLLPVPWAGRTFSMCPGLAAPSPCALVSAGHAACVEGRHSPASSSLRGTARARQFLCSRALTRADGAECQSFPSRWAGMDFSSSTASEEMGKPTALEREENCQSERQGDGYPGNKLLFPCTGGVENL